MNTPQKNPAQEPGTNVGTIGQYTISVSKPSPGEDDAPPAPASGILTTISATCSFNNPPVGPPTIVAHLMTPTPDGPPSDKVLGSITRHSGHILLPPNTASTAYVNLFLEWDNVSLFATSFFPSEFGTIPGPGNTDFDISWIEL